LAGVTFRAARSLGRDMRTMRVGVRYLAVLFTALSPLAVRAQERAHPGAPLPPAVRRAAGCYRIVRAADVIHTSGDTTAPTNRETLPPWFELVDTALAPPLDGLYALRPGTVIPGRKMIAVWRPKRPDSVIVSWSTGFHGIALALVARGDTLVGRSTAFSDAHVIGALEPAGTPILATRDVCGTG
jgi:hypothetical protein